MSYKKAPPSFIDDALEKFRAHESGRGSREQEDRDRSRSRVRVDLEADINPDGKINFTSFYRSHAVIPGKLQIY